MVVGVGTVNHSSRVWFIVYRRDADGLSVNKGCVMRTPFYDIQQRIHEWAECEFGSASHPYPLYKRIKDELDELKEELEIHGTQQTMHSVRTLESVRERVAKECADVAITLFRFCGAAGIDLLSEVEKKQDVNESRRWVAHGDGCGHHVKNEGGI